MSERNLALNSRVESTRDRKKQSPLPQQFSLEEIKQHFDEGLQAIKELDDVVTSLSQAGNDSGCKAIWRLQIVLIESILDYYIHEISKYSMLRMLSGGWDKTEKFDNFMIPMYKVEEALSVAKSDDWFFEYLNDRFSREVYLSKENMRDQLNLIGLNYSEVMVKAFPRDKEQTSIQDGSKIISELFKRRNEIVHQNDRSHASAEQADIKKDYVDEEISNVETLVLAMQSIADEKNKP